MNRYVSAFLVIVFAVGLWMVGGASASADSDPGQVTVTVAPGSISTAVGESVDITVTVVNENSGPAAEMAIHLDITDPKGVGSVDPEDWTPDLTHPQVTLAAGEQVSLPWTIAPISGGNFVLYAVALSSEAGLEPAMPVVSNGVPVHVEEKRSFNPAGILPLAIAMPGLMGVALVWRYRRLRLK